MIPREDVQAAAWLNGETLTLVEQRGDDDCLRACLATIFGVAYEDVPPEVCAGATDSQHNAMQAFLRRYGFVSWTLSLHGEDAPLLKFGNEEPRFHLFPTGFWLASVRSPRTEDEHVLVMRGETVIWDPHPQREMGHGGFTQAMIFMPIRPLAAETARANSAEHRLAIALDAAAAETARADAAKETR